MFSLWSKNKEEIEREEAKEFNKITTEAFCGDGLLTVAAMLGVEQHLTKAKVAYDNGHREEAYVASFEAAKLLDMMHKPKEAEEARNLVDTLDRRWRCVIS